MNIKSDIRYIGVNDHTIDLFEGMYAVPNGISYNSYIIMDEKVAVIDTVDVNYTAKWLGNIVEELNGRTPDYLIIQHMEPDHSANIMNFINRYPDVTVVASFHAFVMMKGYFGTDFADNRIIVSDGDMLSLGKHKLTFLAAPMVHWPEVIVTYDSEEKVLFSADAFGKFGAPDIKDNWVDEARRYYIGIVGKYGVQVQRLLSKVADLDVQKIYPLHGPMLTNDIDYYIKLYDTWSSYVPEDEGIVIAYTSVYGNTKKAVMLLADKLREKNYTNVVMHDLARCDMSVAVADAFRYSKLVLATTTYNAGIFPPMREYINCLTERGFCNRIVAFIENGGWAPVATRKMQEMLEKSKCLTYTDNTVCIMSALNGESLAQLDMLADELCN